MTDKKSPVLANRYIKVSRKTGTDEKGAVQTEEVSIVPGQEVPDWAVELIDPTHLGDPRDPLEEQDQFLQALRETATREGIKWDETWRKEHLSQAITAVRQAATAGVTLDTNQFGPVGATSPAQTTSVPLDTSEAQSGSGTEAKPLDKMSRDELNAEHQQRFNETPHHALSDDNLRKRLQEARDKG